MTTPATLIGMCFTADDLDRSHYRTGEILSAVSEHVYLVQIDGRDGDASLELVPLSEMLALANDGGKRWSLFKDRADLDKWLDWLDEPSESRVVTLVTK